MCNYMPICNMSPTVHWFKALTYQNLNLSKHGHKLNGGGQADWARPGEEAGSIRAHSTSRIDPQLPGQGSRLI